MNIQYRPEGLPEAHGLYDPRNEHDACGIGLIANIANTKSHRMVADGLSILKNLEHRGAVGADPKAGDGAGILLQIPHGFFSEEAKRLGFELPGPQHYGVGYLFMPPGWSHDGSRETSESLKAAYVRRNPSEAGKPGLPGADGAGMTPAE